MKKISSYSFSLIDNSSSLLSFFFQVPFWYLCSFLLSLHFLFNIILFSCLYFTFFFFFFKFFFHSLFFLPSNSPLIFPYSLFLSTIFPSFLSFFLSFFLILLSYYHLRLYFLFLFKLSIKFHSVFFFFFFCYKILLSSQFPFLTQKFIGNNK